MDIKWKNNNNSFSRSAQLIGLYLLAFSLLCAVDLFQHQHIWSMSLGNLWSRQADADYYASIQSRLVKEILLGGAALAGGAYLYWKHRKDTPPPGLAFRRLLSKPADFRVFTLGLCALLLLFFTTEINFFYLPLRLKHALHLTAVVYLIACFLRLAENLLPLLYNPVRLREEWEQTFLLQYSRLFRSAWSDFRLILAVCFILGITAAAGFIFAVGVLEGNGEVAFLLLLYIVVIIPIMIYILGAFNTIRQGAKDMAEGNLQGQLDTRLRGPFALLVHSINNMREGYRKALEEQVKSERLKTELITNVSHDLKTPLTSIVNYVDLLQRPGLEEETRKKYLEVLTQKTERLKLLIDDLFEASKMASGAVELQAEQIDVAALLEQALAEFSDKIAASSLTFRVKGAERHMLAMLDGRKTWRVFENLIGNALKYAQPGTRVYMQLEEDGPNIRFTMKNISAYEIDFEVEELMERFKRGDASRSTEGSGLGLAIARSIVELQGGSFRIELDGDMFKVTIILPLHRQE